MHPLAEFRLDPFQGSRDPFRYRLAPQPEVSVPLLLAVVRETEEIEGLRSTFPARPAVRHREPSELDEACLVRVQLKRELAHPLPEVVEKLFRIRLALAANDEVIGVTYDDSVPRSLSGAPLLLEPEVEDIVQVNVGEDGRNHRALRGPLQVVLPLVVFHDAGVQPLGNQPEYPFVPDSVLEKPQQVVSREPVEERSNVRVDYPVDLAPFYPESQGVKRIMRPGRNP